MDIFGVLETIKNNYNVLLSKLECRRKCLESFKVGATECFR